MSSTAPLIPMIMPGPWRWMPGGMWWPLALSTTPAPARISPWSSSGGPMAETSDPGEAQGGVRAFGARVRRRLILDPDPQPQGILHEMKDAIAALGDLPAQSLRQVLSHRILDLPHRPPPSAQGLSYREESGRQIKAWTYVLISTELLCAP